MACARDQNCIAFHAIQSGCIEYRNNCSKLNVSKYGDFRLCKKSFPLKNEIDSLIEYNKLGNVQDIGSHWLFCKDGLDCFHDAFVKSNEPGKHYKPIIRQ